MMEEPMYSGVLRRSAEVPVVALPREGMSERVAEGLAEVGKQLGGMLAQGVELEEERREMEAERQLMETQQWAQQRMEEALRLPDGEEGAVFDRGGKLRLGVVKSMSDEVGKQLRTAGAGLLSAERRQRIQARAADVEVRLLNGMKDAWEKVEREKLGAEWHATYARAEAAGDVALQRSLLDRAARIGAMGANAAARKKGQLAVGQLKKAAAGKYRPSMGMKRSGGGVVKGEPKQRKSFTTFD